MNSVPGIEIKGLTKAYHDADHELSVLDSISYQFPNKGSVAVVGRSGVGKSTLLHLLGGLIAPTSGEVLVKGTDICSLSEEKLSTFRGAQIGFVFQYNQLLGEFTALENVEMPLIIQGVSSAEAKVRALEILSRVGLEGRVSHRPGELSGGEQQRVALARAVVSKPAIVLADEPTGSLDFETSSEVSNLLLEINQELGNLLVVVTHSLELASRMELQLEMLPGGELSDLDMDSFRKESL